MEMSEEMLEKSAKLVANSEVELSLRRDGRDRISN